MKRMATRIVEVALLIPAFGFFIPPVPSEPETWYGLLPDLAYGVLCLAISLALACRRGGESWPVAILKVGLFCGFGWLLHERVWMGQ